MTKHLLPFIFALLMCIVSTENIFAQDCYPPDWAWVENGNITSTSAYIEWEDYNNSTSWDIVVSPTMLPNPATGNVVNVTEMHYLAQNLNPQTLYYVYLRSHCSGSEISDWMEMEDARFTTACAPESIPFTATFTNEFPICWTSLLSSAPTMGYLNSTYVMQLRYACAVALPQFTEPINTLRINFEAYCNNTANVLIVGVMDDLEDWSSFTAVDTVHFATANAYLEEEIHFNSYTGAGQYIVLQWDGSTSLCRIRNVVVSEMPNCLNPINVTASNISSNRASLSWNEAGTATQWRAVLSQTPVTNFNTQNLMTFNTPSYTPTSLAANTTYYFYVQSVCSATEYSEWSNISFTTTCGSAALPFSEGFNEVNTIPDCWSIELVAGNAAPTIVASGQNPYTSPAAGYAMVQWASSGYATTQQARLISQPISAANISTLDVNFMWHHDSGAPEATNEGVQIQYSFDGTNWSNTSQGLIPRYSALFNGWTEYDVYIPEAAGHSLVYIGFLFKAGHGQNCFLDEVSFREISGCLPPAGVNVTNVTGNTADINWTEMGSATQWNVVVSSIPLENPSTSSDIVTRQTTSYTVTGLNPTSTYYVYVQSVCSGSTSDWSRYVSFTTECGTILQLPYYESFDECAVASYPDCWFRTGAGLYQSTTTPAVLDISSVDGDKSLMLCTPSNSYTYVISPAISEEIHNVTAAFFLYKENAQLSGSLEIGVMSDFQDMASFEPVDTIVPTIEGNWEFFRVPFTNTNISGSNRYIAFRHHAVSDFNYFLLDEVSIEQSSDCWHAVNLEVSNITGNSATFSWVDANEPGTRWHLKMSETPMTNMSATAHVIDTLILGNTFTIDYLNGDSRYYYYLQPDCGNNTGDWISGELTTEPCNCFLRFYLYDDFGNGWEGAKIQLKQGNVVFAEITLGNGAADTVIVYTCNAGNIDFYYVGGSFDSDNSFRIEDMNGMELYHSAGTPTSGCFTSRTLNCGVSCNTTPTNVTATNISGGARITWNSVANAQTYTIYRNGTLIADYITSTSYIDNNMVSGQNCYTVAATCIVGESNQSNSSCVVGLNDYANASHINIFPNPANDRITVTSDFNMNKIVITNLLGQQIWSQESNGTQMEISLPFSNGLYLLKVWDGQAWTTQKFIIQK